MRLTENFRLKGAGGAAQHAAFLDDVAEGRRGDPASGALGELPPRRSRNFRRPQHVPSILLFLLCCLRATSVALGYPSTKGALLRRLCASLGGGGTLVHRVLCPLLSMQRAAICGMI
jgi:hypothetical protein